MRTKTCVRAAGAVLALWTITAGLPAAAQQTREQLERQTPDTTVPGGRPTEPTTFVAELETSDQFETESSRIALAKSTRPEIKTFAQKMMDDHTASGVRLREAQQGISTRTRALDAESAPPRMPDVQAALLKRMELADPAEFDRLYVAAQIQAHERAVRLVGDYAEQGTEPSLKALAGDLLPALRQHLDMARALPGGR